MKREIKFRGKRLTNNEWEYGYYIYCEEWEIHYILLTPIDGGTVGQYTGLKDKNGKEIYEGDILSVCNGSINGMEWMEKPYVVEYKSYGWDICAFCWDKKGNSIMDSTHWCEVLGNIHENPELLNQ